MAAGTNAVAVFYDDRTYRVRDWDNLNELRDRRRILLVGVQHHQSTDPTDLPNGVQHTGHDLHCFVRTDEGLIVRDVDFSRGLELPITVSGDVVFEEDGGLVLQGSSVIGQGELIRERSYQEAPPFNQITVTLPTPASIGAGGMDVAHYAKSFEDADYDTLQNDALDKSTDIKADPVPADGTY